MSILSTVCTPPPTVKAISWFERLLDALCRWLDASLVHQAAGELARECRDTVWEHTGERTCGMGRAQARGYLRAVAPAFLAREVDVVLNRRRLGANFRPYVLREAIEHVIVWVAEETSRAEVRRIARSVAA